MHIETPQQLVDRLTFMPRTLVPAILDRDAAIRRQMAEEVLGRVEAIARVLHYPAAEIIAGEVRSEYASQDKSMNMNQTETETSGAHDEEVARRAKVGVFKELFAIEFKNPFHEHEPRLVTVLDRIREQAMLIAARHGITPAEIEPVKVYTVGDIVAVPGSRMWYVRCGSTRSPWYWKDSEWVQYDPSYHDDYANLSRFNAEAIAAHLRATGNVPGVK